MDIAIQIVVIGSEIGRICSIQDATICATLIDDEYIYNETIGSPRTAFLYITGMPSNDLEKIKRILTKGHYEIQGIDSYGDPNEVQVKQRRWETKIDNHPSFLKLKNKKNLTVTWGEAQSRILHSVEDRAIQASDLNG